MKQRFQKTCLLLALVSMIGAQSFALQPGGRRASSHHHRRFLRWNPLFRPSHESLLLQNEEIDRLELPRIQDDEELEQLKSTGDLVPIVQSEYLRFDPRLDPDRRFCRPWTRDFVDDLSKAYYEEFHTQIQINSAVRTVKIQKKLRRHNRNAAPETGETASSHLAGITVDIQRRGMTRKQVKWMEQYMLPLKNLGVIEPEEERHQWVFHVMVSDRYVTWRDTGSTEVEADNQTPQNSVPENSVPAVDFLGNDLQSSDIRRVELETVSAPESRDFVRQEK